MRRPAADLRTTKWVMPSLWRSVGAVRAVRRRRRRRRHRAGRVAARTRVRWPLRPAMEAEGFRRSSVWPGSEVAGRAPRAMGPTQSGANGSVFIGVEGHGRAICASARRRGEAAHGVDGLALGPAEVCGEDDFGLAAQGVLDGRRRCRGYCSCRRWDRARLWTERHVEVNTDEDALAGEIEVADR